MSVVLDASAVLVLLLDEPGAEVVVEVLSDGVLSAVNLAGVLSKVSDRGADVSGLAEDLLAAGVLVEPMTVVDAAQVAELRRIRSGRTAQPRRPLLPSAGAPAGSACAGRRPCMAGARR